MRYYNDCNYIYTVVLLLCGVRVVCVVCVVCVWCMYVHVTVYECE